MTAAAVADESNARVTISAALAASVAGWDESGNARLPPSSLFIGCGQDLFFFGLQLLAEDTAPSAAVQGLHVALADIFEAQLRAANSSLARGKFVFEDVLGYTVILHPAHVTKPLQPALSELHKHGGETSAFEDLSVGHYVSPLNAKDAG